MKFVITRLVTHTQVVEVDADDAGRGASYALDTATDFDCEYRWDDEHVTYNVQRRDW